MTRRSFLATGAALATDAITDPLRAAEIDNPANWVGATRLVDSAAPAIRRLAASLTQGQSDPAARVGAVFDHVSRRIRFGFATGFWDMSASAVLAAGVGYCNTKSTLFVALLRAAGVPARQRFMDIDAGVLAGIIDPGTRLVDHSTTEVWLDGRWIETDAYIVDPPLLRAARRRLAATDAVFGYGIHRGGTSDWDTAAPAYSQYNRNAGGRLGAREWGVFADVGDFYARADGSWNRLNFIMRSGFGLLAAGANRRADALRASG